jgi:hypothetical protein
MHFIATRITEGFPMCARRWSSIAVVVLLPALAIADEPASSRTPSIASEGPAEVMEDRGLHLSLASGLGGAYDLIGLHLGLRYRHVSLFAGTGVPLFLSTEGPGPSATAGFRWFSGPGRGLVISVQAFGTHRALDGGGLEQSLMLSATAGWRFSIGRRFFLEAGAGPQFGYHIRKDEDQRHVCCEVKDKAWRFGWASEPGYWWVPDVQLAAGFEL